jgi:pseudouridine-5'-phosphate glycosidase
VADLSSVDIRPAVAAALKEGRPVVSITSSPFTHTLPWHASLQTIRAMADAAGQLGVLTAIIAIKQGRMTVGIEPEELEEIVRHHSPQRTTRRDIAWTLVKGLNGGTTVSSSMLISSLAGIRVLVTSAIGSARSLEAADTPPTEVSADLVELMQTPVAVVSAGARSVANVAYTAQVLETFRVPVVGYRSDLFPTFYMNVGECPPSVRIDQAADVAAMLHTHWSIGGGGVVIAQPTPTHLALSPDVILPALQLVEGPAAKHTAPLKHLTPPLMERLNNITHGKAMATYQGIMLANGILAAEIAVEFARGK